MHNACTYHRSIGSDPDILHNHTPHPTQTPKKVPAKLEYLELYETPAALLLLGTDRQRVCICIYVYISVYCPVLFGSCVVAPSGSALPIPTTHPKTHLIRPPHPNNHRQTQQAYHVLRMDRRVPVGPRTPLSAVVSLVSNFIPPCVYMYVLAHLHTHPETTNIPFTHSFTYPETTTKRSGPARSRGGPRPYGPFCWRGKRRAVGAVGVCGGWRRVCVHVMYVCG